MPVANPRSSAAEQPQSAVANSSIKERLSSLLTPTERADLRAQWKALIAKHTADKIAWKALPGTDRNSERPPTLPAYAHMLYAVLLGRDWRKGFTPLRNKRKLENGTSANWAYWLAARFLTMGLVPPLSRDPDLAARTAPFQIFASSVPVFIQLEGARRLPKLPLWAEGYSAEQVVALWPTAPYREELHADAPAAQ